MCGSNTGILPWTLGFNFSSSQMSRLTPHYSHIFSLASQTHVRASLGRIALCETTNRDGFLAGGHRKSPVINPHNLKPLRVLVVLNIFIYI